MLLSDAEIEDLCTAICMKPGHRKRFPVLIKREREQAEREQLLIKREREKAKREREREEEEQEHRHRLEKSRRRRELEADEAGGKTDAAMTKQNTSENQHSGMNTSSIEPRSADNNALTNPVDAGIVLPEGKRFGCFISHKVGE